MTGSPSPVLFSIGGLLAMAAALGVGRFVYTPILPVMMSDLGLTAAQAGMIASANFLGYLAGALVVGLIRLPGSRSAWLLAALLLNALFMAAMALTDSLPVFVILRFAGGAISAFVLVLSSALVMERLAQLQRTGLSAVHFAGVGAGIAASALLVAIGNSLGFGWRGLWLLVAGTALVAALILPWLLPADRPNHAASSSAAQLNRSRALWWLALAYGLVGFGYVITATFLVAIVRHQQGFPGLETITWLVVGLSAMPSVWLWNRVTAGIGLNKAFCGACLLEAMGVTASVVWPTPAGALLAALFLGGTFMGLTALGLAEARRLAPRNAPAALALLTAAFGVGQAVGPALAGYLSDAGGGFLLPSLLAASGLVLSALIIIGPASPRTL